LFIIYYLCLLTFVVALLVGMLERDKPLSCTSLDNPCCSAMYFTVDDGISVVINVVVEARMCVEEVRTFGHARRDGERWQLLRDVLRKQCDGMRRHKAVYRYSVARLRGNARGMPLTTTWRAAGRR